jgi:hypothetical protein
MVSEHLTKYNEGLLLLLRLHRRTGEVIFLFLWERDVWLVRNASGLLISCVSKCSDGTQGCRIPPELPALLDVTLGVYSVVGMTLILCDPAVTVAVERNGA